MDSKNSLDDQNLIIYGHHRRDGSMFGTIDKLIDNKNGGKIKLPAPKNRENSIKLMVTICFRVNFITLPPKNKDSSQNFETSLVNTIPAVPLKLHSAAMPLIQAPTSPRRLRSLHEYPYWPRRWGYQLRRDRIFSRCLPGFHLPRLSGKRICRIRLRHRFSVQFWGNHNIENDSCQ